MVSVDEVSDSLFVGLSLVSIAAAVIADDPDRIYYGTDTAPSNSSPERFWRAF